MGRIVFCLFCFIASVLSAAKEIQPVLEWNFDRPDLFDIRPDRGTVMGHLHKNSRYDFVPGFTGKALRLGETEKIGGVWFQPLPVDLTKPFTISIKLKLTADFVTPEGFRKYKEIWGNANSAGPGIRMNIYMGNIIFRTGDGLHCKMVGIPRSRFQIPVEKWFQIVTVYDGERVTLYANGKAYGSKEMTLTASDKPFNVGSMFGIRNPLQGLVDDLQIYDRALSADQVRKITLKKQ